MRESTRTRPLELDGCVALVTGASRGIGRAIATAFAREGASLVLHYHDEEGSAEEVAGEIEAAGGRALKLGANLRSPGEIGRLFEEVERRMGVVTVLVNNAGIYPLHALVDATPEAWQEVLETNLNGVHYCTRSMARRLVETGAGGAIVNVASIDGLRPAPLHSHYTASKAGVLAYTRSAAVELGAHGIRVNAVSPGLIWREGIEEAWPEGVEAFLARAPLGRLGTAEDVANACLFLASDAAAFVTGANLLVDGGVLAAAAF
jgi:NAD(P)-dependent dehydrogenase (short-subunit alcohol dehydrogenase family)